MTKRKVTFRHHKCLLIADQKIEFAVNGTSLPEVDFDVGESYAGLLPIGDANDPNQLYFWFFPSTNPAAAKEITIWLTGGVGWNHFLNIVIESDFPSPAVRPQES